jgi:hypothetical protein
MEAQAGWPIQVQSLNGAAIAVWWVLTLVAVGVLTGSARRLRRGSAQQQTRRSAAQLAALLSVLLLLWLNGSPSRWVTRHLAADLGPAEETVRRFEAYRSANGRYPPSVDTVYYEGLDVFDEVNGEPSSDDCDPFGSGCEALRIHAVDAPEPRIFLQVHLGTMECGATTADPVWRCRDHM